MIHTYINQIKDNIKPIIAQNITINKKKVHKSSPTLNINE